MYHIITIIYLFVLVTFNKLLLLHCEDITIIINDNYCDSLDGSDETNTSGLLLLLLLLLFFF